MPTSGIIVAAACMRILLSRFRPSERGSLVVAALWLAAQPLSNHLLFCEQRRPLRSEWPQTYSVWWSAWHFSEVDRDQIGAQRIIYTKHTILFCSVTFWKREQQQVCKSIKYQRGVPARTLWSWTIKINQNCFRQRQIFQNYWNKSQTPLRNQFLICHVVLVTADVFTATMAQVSSTTVKHRYSVSPHQIPQARAAARVGWWQR